MNLVFSGSGDVPRAPQESRKENANNLTGATPRSHHGFELFTQIKAFFFYK